jgi:hydrogenase maturation protein HypF
MVDNGIEGEVIGVSFDGTGYGTDGKIWGGEFLVCDYGGFDRVAHLDYTPLPGGESAIKEPWRMAASYLDKIYGDEMPDLEIEFIKSLHMNKWATVKKMIEKGVNTPLTSSAGRLFDAVSALLGVRKEVYYEGQAAIELEMAAGQSEGTYSFELRETGDKTEIIVEPLIRGIISDLVDGVTVEAISSKVHNTFVQIILNMCLKIRKASGIKRVVLSGGVFQNALLLDNTFAQLDANRFEIFTHERVPPNDGGIALGQAIIANQMIKEGRI